MIKELKGAMMLTSLTKEQIAEHWNVISSEFFSSLGVPPQYILNNYLKACLDGTLTLNKFEHNERKVGLLATEIRLPNRFTLVPQLFIVLMDFFIFPEEADLKQLKLDLVKLAKSQNALEIAVMVHNPEFTHRLKPLFAFDKAHYLTINVLEED